MNASGSKFIDIVYTRLDMVGWLFGDCAKIGVALSSVLII